MAISSALRYLEIVALKIRKVHALEWVLEPLEAHPAYFRRKMFGCEAAYLHGKLVLVLAEGKEPWNGLMVATAHEHHCSLQNDFPELKSHRILGKWLYLSQRHPSFESTATSIVERILRLDPRIGVDPKPRKRKPR